MPKRPQVDFPQSRTSPSIDDLLRRISAQDEALGLRVTLQVYDRDNAQYRNWNGWQPSPEVMAAVKAQVVAALKEIA